MHIYVLNLERRNDRLSHFFEECKREGIEKDKITVFKGLDAQTYVFSEEEKNMFKNTQFDINTDTGRGCMCNQLGHYYMLMDMIEKGYDKCIIFQDDVRFRRGFVKDIENLEYNLPQDAEIVWLGFHLHAAGSSFKDFPIDEDYEKTYVKEKINDYCCKLTDDINPCSLAYIVTRECAKKYVEYAKTEITEATDNQYNIYLRNKNIMYASYDVLCTGNSNFKSDIFKYDDNAIGRDILEMLENL